MPSLLLDIPWFAVVTADILRRPRRGTKGMQHTAPTDSVGLWRHIASIRPYGTVFHGFATAAHGAQSISDHEYGHWLKRSRGIGRTASVLEIDVGGAVPSHKGPRFAIPRAADCCFASRACFSQVEQASLYPVFPGDAKTYRFLPRWRSYGRIAEAACRSLIPLSGGGQLSRLLPVSKMHAIQSATPGPAAQYASLQGLAAPGTSRTRRPTRISIGKFRRCPATRLGCDSEFQTVYIALFQSAVSSLPRVSLGRDTTHLFPATRHESRAGVEKEKLQAASITRVGSLR
jgi:hypothetical protein